MEDDIKPHNLLSEENVKDLDGKISSHDEEIARIKRQFLDLSRVVRPRSFHRSANFEKIDTKIEDVQETKRKEIENRGREQDIVLKKETLDKLFRLLSYETIAIFALTILQGFRFIGFYLEEWSFRLLVAATISQITIMLLIAVKHLFPEKPGKS